MAEFWIEQVVRTAVEIFGPVGFAPDAAVYVHDDDATSDHVYRVCERVEKVCGGLTK